MRAQVTFELVAAADQAKKGQGKLRGGTFAVCLRGETPRHDGAQILSDLLAFEI
jgi:hypothetical protein